MGETRVFLLLTVIAAMAASAVILPNRSVTRAGKMGRGFYVLAVALSLAAMLLVLLGSFHLLPESAAYAFWLRLLIYRGWIVIGVAIAAAAVIVGNVITKVREAPRAFATSPPVMKGICFSVALSFLCTEVGKIAHDSDMRQFFLGSGYPVWFLYFIIVAEIVGAIGLLVRRTVLPSALGLSVIMLGAIRTHVHNRDPFSDSLEALHLLILLVCIVVIGLTKSPEIFFRFGHQNRNR